MADYLEAYAARFGLPIRTGMPVDGVTGDRDGAVLVVGAGNSGAEIALESAGAHQVWLSGREVGAIPFRMGGLPSRLLLERLALRVLLHRVLTVRTPMGRKMRARMGAGERR
jgi:putative flavoprotein involved in K+ transport